MLKKTIVRIISLMLTIALAPAVAEVTNCTNCYQDGVDAQQRGEADRALRLFERGCEQDDGAACRAAAYMLSEGEGIPSDGTRAIPLYFRACNLGHWQACHDIGANMVRFKNPQLAAQGRELLTRGCEGGNGPSCGALGRAMINGQGGIGR